MADTDGLKVHAENRGDFGRGAVMGLALDLVENGIDLERVVALDVLEAVGPGGKVGAGVAHGGAGVASGGLDAGQRYDVGIDLGRVVIVNRAARAGDGAVRGVLVRPGRVAAGVVNDVIDRVGADEVPRIDGCAALGGVARQLGRVDGRDAAFGERRAGSTAIELGLVEINALFVLGGGAGRDAKGRARAGLNAVAGGFGGGIKRAVVGDIVVDAHGARGRAGDQGHQAREGVGGLAGGGCAVGDTGLAEPGEVGAVGLAAVDTGDAVRAVAVVNGVHAIDAEEQHVLDRGVRNVLRGNGAGTSKAGDGNRCGS